MVSFLWCQRLYITMITVLMLVYFWLYAILSPAERVKKNITAAFRQSEISWECWHVHAGGCGTVNYWCTADRHPLQEWSTFSMTVVQNVQGMATAACVGLMSFHRLRRWPDIKPTQGCCVQGCTGLSSAALLNLHPLWRIPPALKTWPRHTASSNSRNWSLFKRPVTVVCRRRW